VSGQTDTPCADRPEPLLTLGERHALAGLLAEILVEALSAAPGANEPPQHSDGVNE
jgi:hypothetical protein